MENELIAVLVTLGTTIVGAFAGAFMSGRFGYRQSANIEEDRRRRQAADTALPVLIDLRRLLRNAENSRVQKEWAEVTASAYEALDDARHMMPKGLKHLKRSIRASIGEAVGGVAVADMDPRTLEYDLAPYDYRWTNYAEEYLDGAISRLREWRDASRSKSTAVTMPNFDDWLRLTNRYTPGES